MTKTVFVTGATGFIGANLVKKLSMDGYTIRALVRKGSNHPFLEHLPIKRVDGDILDYKLLEKETKECDVIIHLAALISFNEEQRRSIYELNVVGTNNILKAAEKNNVRKIVFVSSAATVGAPTKENNVLNEDACFVFKETNSYSHAKYIAEQNVLRYVKNGGSAVIVNPSTVYGAGDIWGNSGSLLQIIKKYPIHFAPPGLCAVVAVQDVVEGIILAMENGKSGQRYLLTNENISFQHLFEIIHKVIKKRKGIFFKVPFFLYIPVCFALKKAKISSKIITPYVVANLFKKRFFDNNKAKKELVWEPKVPIQQAIEEMYLFQEENSKKTYKEKPI